MKVSEFTTVDGKSTLILTEAQELALEHAQRLTRTGYRRIRQFDGAPTYSDAVIRGLIADYDRITAIAPSTDGAEAYVVTDPVNPSLEEQRATLDLALKCAKYRFGCNVVTILAEHTHGKQEELCRVASEIRVALLVISYDRADH